MASAANSFLRNQLTDHHSSSLDDDADVITIIEGRLHKSPHSSCCYGSISASLRPRISQMLRWYDEKTHYLTRIISGFDLRPIFVFGATAKFHPSWNLTTFSDQRMPGGDSELCSFWDVNAIHTYIHTYRSIRDDRMGLPFFFFFFFAFTLTICNLHLTDLLVFSNIKMR